eukprot:11937825-Ditylum_brightwellii.AAC.2
MIYNVADNLEQTEKTYDYLPKGAWSRGLLARSYSTKTKELTKTKSTSPPQQNNDAETNVKDKYKEIKKSMDDNYKKYIEALYQINESLAQ